MIANTELTLAMADLNREQREAVRVYAAGSTQRDAYIKAYGPCKTIDVTDTAATQVFSSIRVKRAIAAMEAPKDAECKNRRQECLDQTDAAIKRAEEKGNEAAVATLLTLKSRQMAMLTDKVKTETTTPDAPESEGERTAAIAAAKTYKLHIAKEATV